MNTKEIEEAFNLYDYCKMSQEQLGEIALNHTNIYVRCFAIHRLTDQSTLERIALNEECHVVLRGQAVQSITNIKTLKHIFLYGNVWSLQYEALERLSKLGEISKIIPCGNSDFEDNPQ